MFLAGETYDAYSELSEIVDSAKKSLIIIDPYADKSLLDLLKNAESSIKIISSSKARLSGALILKFNKQYGDKLGLYIAHCYLLWLNYGGRPLLTKNATVQPSPAKKRAVTSTKAFATKN